VAWDAAAEFAQRGYAVTLYAGFGSSAPRNVRLVAHADEFNRAISTHDAWLDFSHHHHLSRLYPALPVVNYISDSECTYQPPNACVCTRADQSQYPSAALVPLGVDVKRIPFNDGKRGDYLAFLAKIIPHKGVDLALQLQRTIQRPIIFAGERLMSLDLPCYAGELAGDEAYHFLGYAYGLLQLARIGTGGGRIQLEAAACGTPTLCLAGNGTQEHVAHDLSGYLCADLDSLRHHIDALSSLSPAIMRQWVTETHSIEIMVDALETLIHRTLDGERW
jgi:glycosyltransferase involved in cell wall biosynthesis